MEVVCPLCKFDALFGFSLISILPMAPRSTVDRLPDEFEVSDGFKWFIMTKREFIDHFTKGEYDLVIFPDGTLGLASNFGNYYTKIKV